MEDPVQIRYVVFNGLQLSIESSRFHNWIMDNLGSLDANPSYILVHGPAGSGKSLLLQAIRKGVQNYFKNDNACITSAPTAIASEVIGGGTIHSTFILNWGSNWADSMELEEFMEMCNETQLRTLSWMQHAKLLLIDGINFVSSNDLARIDHRLQEITGNREPFGGLSVIVFGDFYQVPPKKGRWIFQDMHPDFIRKAQEKTPLSPAKLWDFFKIYELPSRNMRVAEDEQSIFEYMLYDIDNNFLFDRLKKLCFVCWDKKQTTEAIVEEYKQICQVNPEKTFAILTAENKIAEDLNDAIVHRVPEMKHILNKVAEGSLYAKRWKSKSIDLILAKSVPVILTDNFGGVRSGTLGYVENFPDDDEILVEFPNGKVSVHRLEYKHNDQYFLQFPLRVAYAHTIERAQGATFDGIILVRNKTWTMAEIWNWGDHEDGHGELYTALSRCRSLKNSKVTPLRFMQWGPAREVVDELERMRRECPFLRMPLVQFNH